MRAPRLMFKLLGSAQQQNLLLSAQVGGTRARRMHDLADGNDGCMDQLRCSCGTSSLQVAFEAHTF